VQKATVVNGPWVELQTVTAPATVTDAVAGTAAFYRAVAK
jgi:hypothetical protein